MSSSFHHTVRLVALLLGLVVSTACGQETQVPIDSAGRLDRIDGELEQKLGLFPEFKDFQEARLYRVPPTAGSADSSFVLEISYLIEGTQQRVRRPLSRSEAEEFRRTVTERISSRSPEITLNQEGRARLITGTTILGLTYYGFAVPGTFNVDDTRTIVALYMLTAASGFFVPYIITGNSQVTNAQASLSLYGATAGAMHGALLYGVVSDNIDGSTLLGISVVTGIAEAFAGYHIAGAYDLGEGKTNVITGIGTFGLGVGAGAAYLLGAEKERPYFAAMLLGTGAGFLAGNAIANMQPYSAGDAQVLLTSGAVGAYTPVALLLLFESRDDDLYVASTMLGGIAGLWLGDHLVKGREFSDAQGNYVALGTLAGTALGLGTAYLITSDDAGDNDKVYAAASLVGSVGGFALMYALLQDDAKVRRETRNWNFDIAPVGICSLLFGAGHRSRTTIPIAGFQYRFE